MTPTSCYGDTTADPLTRLARREAIGLCMRTCIEISTRALHPSRRPCILPNGGLHGRASSQRRFASRSQPVPRVQTRTLRLGRRYREGRTLIDMPRVSIIMPTLNCAAHPADARESIRSQSHPGWELLIMDAVSTDVTVELARSYGDSRIRISTAPDEGILPAWDKGAKRAR